MTQQLALYAPVDTTSVEVTVWPVPPVAQLVPPTLFALFVPLRLSFQAPAAFPAKPYWLDVNLALITRPVSAAAVAICYQEQLASPVPIHFQPVRSVTTQECVRVVSRGTS